jgi:two-component system, cell cycle sensor histidine kinase and response regulator CckA
MSPTLPAAPEWSLLFERAGCACVVMSPGSWEVLAVSDRYLQLLTQQRELVTGRDFFELWERQAPVPETQAALLAALQQVFATREPLERSLPCVSAVGGVSAWLSRVAPICDQGGDVMYLVHALEGPLSVDTQEIDAIRGELEAQVRERNRDLERTSERLLWETAEHLKTERVLKRTEEQLKQAQKLDALGRLAGGIAHDFNNLLSVMLGYSSSLFLEPGFSPAVRTQIGEIKKAAERAAELTLQLLAFSRGQVLEPRVVDLNASLLGIETMLQRVLGEDIELRFALSPGLGRVRVDPGQIEQVIMNLVINARDAMPTGGTLSIETKNIAGDALVGEQLGIGPGPHVVMAVSDDGCGMDKATQARIFEPFFTTKEAGKGTGLGLSTAFGIIKQSGGDIGVCSAPGAGTTFQVYLPQVDAAPVAANDSWPLRDEPRGSETVLVVEDESQVRRLACSVLRNAGYHVLEAQDADEALRLRNTSKAPVDLLLTDVVMPKMSGRELAERIAALGAPIKVLYMSGYTDDAVLRHGVSGSGAAFLQKPLTPGMLTRKVREVLDD